MLARILENNESLYHTQPPLFSNAQSGQELKKYLRQWKPAYFFQIEA